jgi:hypothetical protein
MYLSAEQRSVCLCADAQSQAASEPPSISTSIAGPALVVIATAESFTLSASESLALSTPDSFILSVAGSLTLAALESDTQSASRITPRSNSQSGLQSFLQLLLHRSPPVLLY